MESFTLPIVKASELLNRINCNHQCNPNCQIQRHPEDLERVRMVPNPKGTFVPRIKLI